jgi:hypothetical protein
MIMFGSFLPSLLVGFATTKVYSGVGADIVMESITLIDPSDRGFECNGDFANNPASFANALDQPPTAFSVAQICSVL